MPIRVAIVENDTTYASAVQQVLNYYDSGFSCEHVFFDGVTALHELPKLAPDVILMDIDLGTGQPSGIDCISQLKPQIPDTLFMVLTIYEDDKKVFESLAVGALGYLLKGTSSERIIEAVHELYDGGAPMSPRIAKLLALSFSKPIPIATAESAILTSREKEVIQLISKGRLEKEVADDLYISVKTVKSHISNIYDKLQVRTRVEALNKYHGR